MKHKPDTVVFAAGWVESQAETWLEKAKADGADEGTVRIFEQLYEMALTISEGALEMAKRILELERQITAVRQLAGTDEEKRLAAIRSALIENNS